MPALKQTMTTEIIEKEAVALKVWHQRLDAARGVAITSVLGFAQECYAFQQACAAKQGGSTYTTYMEEWFGIKNPASSQWATVGAHTPKLLAMANKLPPAMETLYLLCDVPDDVIATMVTPTTTKREARTLKTNHGTKPRKPKTQKTFRIGWRDALVQAGVMSYGQMNGGSAHALASEIEAKLGFKPPMYFYDHAAATAFVDQVRPLRAAPPPPTEFTEPQQKKLQRAAEAARKAEVAALRKVFPDVVEEEVKKRLAPLAEQYGKWIDEAKKEKEFYENLTADLRTFMTKEEYRLVVGCLHADKWQGQLDEDFEKRLNKAFEIMKRVGRIFGEK